MKSENNFDIYVCTLYNVDGAYNQENCIDNY